MEVFSMTDIGRKREVNQDYVFSTGERIGNLPDLFVVADGMGGHKAGDLASQYATHVLVDQIRYSQQTEPELIISEAVYAANRKLVKMSQEDESLQGMGTTLVVATIVDHILYFANIGDSRLYVVGDEIRQISKDHSLVEEMVRLGGLNEEEAKHHPDKNIITRAIGVKNKVEPDFFEYHLQKKDIVLMCTDGLTNMVEDDELFAIVKNQKDVEKAVRELINKANENGGKDNIGIVLIKPFADEENT